MTQLQKHPLRPFSTQEERELRRIVKASSERIDVVRRARAWNGKRRQRRERTRLRRLAGSGAALVKGYSIAS